MGGKITRSVETISALIPSPQARTSLGKDHASSHASHPSEAPIARITPNTGFSGHRLRSVGLASAWQAFEQQAAAGRTTHLRGERLVREEEVDRTNHFFLDGLDADDVTEPYVDLLRANAHRS